MNINMRIFGIIVAASFVAGAFIASPELRAYAADTVGSSDIIDESILSQDIKNGEVKAADIGVGAVTSVKIADNTITAADIAPDAVGASEITGVTKLVFAGCTQDLSGIVFVSGSGTVVDCSVAGTSIGDNVIATLNSASGCFDLRRALPHNDIVSIRLINECRVSSSPGIVNISIQVFDT